MVSGVDRSSRPVSSVESTVIQETVMGIHTPHQRHAFTLVELLVVIAIIGTLVGLLLPAVQAAREAARRSQCQNNMKQLGLGVVNFESATRKLPSPGQCDSTGGSSTTYSIHSIATVILPYIEQTNVYNQFDTTSIPFTLYGATLNTSGASAGNYTTASGGLLHKKAKGRSYDDPAFPSGQVAAKTKIETFLCPSTPVGDRDPVHGYGGVDYMVFALSDVDTAPGSATYGMRTPSAGSAAWLAQVVAPMLSCDGVGMGQISDGSSKTLLWIEDASRSHPSVAKFGALSSRVSPVSSPADPVPYGTALPGTMGGRRVFAWADPDAVANGYSGPSNSLGSRVAKINNNKTPIGGPAECLWSVNNCGPNDEPFAFHAGGVNSCMGDGSVRYINDDIDGVIVKWLVGSSDGQNVNFD